jgi:hypothetical protein
MSKSWLSFVFLCCHYLVCYGQPSGFEEVAMTKEEYIRSNHIEDIETLVHNFMNSKSFLTFLLEEGHDIDPNTVVIKKKDMGIGDDIDIYVKHYTEHQNFTMLMVPVSIYSLAIYDTLLFSVIEVSDQWMKDRFFRNDLEDDSVKAHLLTIENHTLLSRHMYDQALAGTVDDDDITEVEINLHESYISASTIHLHISDLDPQEKKEFRRSWGLMKKAFQHDINLNVEMNVYLFGHDDMKIIYHARDSDRIFRITPDNIFTRHHFSSES